MAKIRRVAGPGKAQLQVMLNGLQDNKQGKVGWFESARYENGTAVATIAAIHEYGAPGRNIPPRPFFRPTIADKQAEWRSVVVQGAERIVRGQATQADVLEVLGLKAAGDVAAKIASIQSPALKKSTVDARRRRRADRKTVGNLTKPLVDTGLMISTISNTVEDVS